jgi:hypothetical protein
MVVMGDLWSKVLNIGAMEYREIDGRKRKI